MAAEVRVEVIDLLGRRVLALPARAVAAGAGRTVEVDASSLSSGVYFYRVVAQTDVHTMVETGRLVVVK